MKSIICAAIWLLMFSSQLTAASSQEYGQAITLSNITEVSDILNAPEQYLNKKVLITGTVVAVCSHRGCWMDIAAKEAFKKIQVKVADGEIVFPISAKGKEALVEGIVERLDISKEAIIRWRKHQAERQGKTFDPKTVTGGETIYRIKGIGAVIKD
jgi:hypothetical protein